MDQKMKLTTLKPRLLTLNTTRVPTLTTQEVNPRPAGRGWMNTRRRIALRDHYTCAGCGRIWLPNRDHVDHIVPREQGGSDDDSNLQLLCDDPCHKAKTAAEAAIRAAGGRA